jgi:hypothetical protein
MNSQVGSRCGTTAKYDGNLDSGKEQEGAGRQERVIVVGTFQWVFLALG